MKIKAKQNFLQGAFIISLGGIVAKILGACYRIPLANILGAEGRSEEHTSELQSPA